MCEGGWKNTIHNMTANEIIGKVEGTQKGTPAIFFFLSHEL